MNNEFYKELVSKFGNKNQLLKVVEECSELMQPLLQIITRKKENNKNFKREIIIEEMCDVLMTFESLKIIYNISNEEIENYIKFKEQKTKLKYLE